MQSIDYRFNNWLQFTYNNMVYRHLPPPPDICPLDICPPTFALPPKKKKINNG